MDQFWPAPPMRKRRRYTLRQRLAMANPLSEMGWIVIGLGCLWVMVAFFAARVFAGILHGPL